MRVMSKSRTEVLEESRRKGFKAGAAAAATVVIGAAVGPGHRGRRRRPDGVPRLALVDAPREERHQVLSPRRIAPSPVRAEPGSVRDLSSPPQGTSIACALPWAPTLSWCVPQATVGRGRGELLAVEPDLARDGRALQAKVPVCGSVAAWRRLRARPEASGVSRRGRRRRGGRLRRRVDVAAKAPSGRRWVARRGRSPRRRG